jgi:hypothetical protein
MDSDYPFSIVDSPKAEVHFLSSAVPMLDGFKNGMCIIKV